jgi:hypothetical protein
MRGEKMIGQTTAETLYSQAIKSLPVSQRLKLATIILNDIPSHAVTDYSEEWTEEDMREVSFYSLRRAALSFEEKTENA